MNPKNKSVALLANIERYVKIKEACIWAFPFYSFMLYIFYDCVMDLPQKGLIFVIYIHKCTLMSS